MKIQEVIDALEQFAPLPLQESYDNAGLQVGLTEADVSGALLCLDVTESVIDDAVARGCNLIIAHHPLLFRGLKMVSDADYVQRSVWKAVQNNVCIVAMHTNLDNAYGGVNHEIAALLGLECHLPRGAAHNPRPLWRHDTTEPADRWQRHNRDPGTRDRPRDIHTRCQESVRGRVLHDKPASRAQDKDRRPVWRCGSLRPP